jgi:hypothetical protein
MVEPFGRDTASLRINRKAHASTWLTKKIGARDKRRFVDPLIFRIGNINPTLALGNFAGKLGLRIFLKHFGHVRLVKPDSLDGAGFVVNGGLGHRDFGPKALC